MSIIKQIIKATKDILRLLKGKTPYIDKTSTNNWKNWHKTLHVGGKVDKLLMPFNEFNNKSAPPVGQEFLPGLLGLQQIIKDASNANANVRAHGSKWSLNNVAFTNSYLVDSRNLNYHKIGITEDNQVTDNYKNKKDCLSFVQCGLMVKQLNIALANKGQALITSGASDGQTLIGAVSTGTHGGANQVGAMTEFVRGIHLVVQNKHVFVQRESDQAVTSEFSAWLGNATHVLDDNLFNAALVGFGSFGLIHGLLIETEPQYCLERVVKNVDIPDVRKAITDLDMSGLGLPQGDVLPFHFEVALNPYLSKVGDKGAFVRVYYKLPASSISESSAVADPVENHDIHSGMAEKFEKVAEDLGILLSGNDLEKKVLSIGLQVQLGLGLSFKITDPTKRDIRFPSEFFTSDSSDKPTSASPIAATSMEIGVPLANIGAAVDLITDVANANPFAAPLALRYVKKSTATIGFTSLAETTVTMEMPGPYGKIFYPKTGDAHKAVFNALDSSNIPHSYHWGQQLPKNTEWARKAFGENLNAWKTQRLNFLGESGLKMFSTPFIESFIGVNELPPMV